MKYMKLNRKLSWKFLLPLGISLWIIGVIVGGMIGSAIELVGFFSILAGIIDLVRQRRNKRKASENK